MAATFTEQMRIFHITGHGLEGAAAAITAEDFDTVPLLAERGPIRTRFTEQVRQTAERLEDLLALDDCHAVDAVSKDNRGAAAAQYFRVDNLAAVMRRRANPVLRMAAERRERCQHALTALRQALAIVHPPFALFHQSGLLPETLHGELHIPADPCAAALEHAQSQLHAITPALRALRAARLELDDAYDPQVHDPVLHRFWWEAAAAGELAAQAAACPLGSFKRLLRSGCPVLLVVTQPALAQHDLACESPDFAQLAVVQRDAFVLQSSLGAPEHFRSAVKALAKTPRPALAVVATPSAGGWAESVVLAQSEAWPLFTFDPTAGPAFRDCPRLHPVAPNPWTAAHAAALNPGLQNHFRRVPSDAAALTLRSGERLAISRDVAEYCHDRQQAQSVLEQWGAATPAPEPVKNDSKEHTYTHTV